MFIAKSKHLSDYDLYLILEHILNNGDHAHRIGMALEQDISNVCYQKLHIYDGNVIGSIVQRAHKRVRVKEQTMMTATDSQGDGELMSIPIGVCTTYELTPQTERNLKRYRKKGHRHQTLEDLIMDMTPHPPYTKREHITDYMVLLAVERSMDVRNQSNVRARNVVDTLCDVTDAHWRVCYAALDRTMHSSVHNPQFKHLDCGVSDFLSFLYPEGREYLQKLREENENLSLDDFHWTIRRRRRRNPTLDTKVPVRIEITNLQSALEIVDVGSNKEL